MKQFLILFRELDGRTDTHEPAAIHQHQLDWKLWIEQAIAEKKWAGGNPLTLEGNLIKDRKISQGPYTIGTEIVGGYMLLNAASLEEATALTQTCPIFDFDGFAEIREIMGVQARSDR